MFVENPTLKLRPLICSWLTKCSYNNFDSPSKALDKILDYDCGDHKNITEIRH